MGIKMAAFWNVVLCSQVIVVMTESADSSKMSASMHQTTRYYNAEDSHLLYKENGCQVTKLLQVAPISRRPVSLQNDENINRTSLDDNENMCHTTVKVEENFELHV
jgi:hypothetical protein